MALTYVGSVITAGTAVTGITSSTFPTGMAVGDLLIVFGIKSGSTGQDFRINNTTNKWTAGDITTNQAAAWKWRIVDGTETSWQYSWTSGSPKACAGMICVRGFDGTNPMAAASAIASGAGPFDNQVTTVLNGMAATFGGSFSSNSDNTVAIASTNGFTQVQANHAINSVCAALAWAPTPTAGGGTSIHCSTTESVGSGTVWNVMAEVNPGIKWRANNGAGATATTATTAMPTIVAGDLLIAELFINASKTVSISGTGWTIIGQANGGGGYTYAVAWKKAVGSDTTPTWSWDGTSQTYAANCTSYHGQWQGGSPIGAFDIIVGSGTTAGNAAKNSTQDQSVFISMNTTSVSQTVPVPTSYTSTSTFSGGSAPGAAERMSQTATVATTGTSSGATTVTISSAKFGSALIEIYTQTVVETSTIAQTLPGMIQEIDVSVAAGGASSTIDQTLPAMSQALSVLEEEPDTIAMILPLIQQEIDVADSPNADIAQTLPGALQEILITTEIVIESIDQLLPGMVQQALMTSEIETAIITQFFPLAEQDIEVMVGAGPSHIAMTLPGVLQDVIVATEVEITLMDQVLPGALEQILITDQTPPVVIRQTFVSISQDFETVVEEGLFIDMTFPTMDEYPRFTHIDMVLGGTACIPGGGISRSGWWPG